MPVRAELHVLRLAAQHGRRRVLLVHHEQRVRVPRIAELSVRAELERLHRRQRPVVDRQRAVYLDVAVGSRRRIVHGLVRRAVGDHDASAAAEIVVAAVNRGAGDRERVSVQRDRLRAVVPEEKRPGLRASDRGVAGKRNALQIPPVAARRPRAGHRRVVDERAASVRAVAFDDVVVVPVRAPGEINLSAVLHLDCGVLGTAGSPALHGALLDRAVLDDHADAAGIATTDSEARVLLVHHEQALTSLAHLEPRAGERDVVVLARHAFRHVDVEYAAHREVDVVHRHSRIARAGDRDRMITS